MDSLQIANIGQGLSLNNLISSSGAFSINVGVERINQSLSIILNTSKRGVPMLPDLGSRISYLIFELNDDILKNVLEIMIREAIEELEPRVEINSINIYPLENTVQVSILYNLTNTNISGDFNYIFDRSGVVST